MTVIKCKICGGDITVNEDKTLGMCEYCGSTMTLPKVSDDQRAAMFNRGNHFRRIGEFDKALAIYENIVRDNDADAEAHWCCALCRFGIEYVEDPATYEYIPTCHRASFDSFQEDVDYLAAIEYSDGIARRQYQKDAAKIAEIQKGILATSQNEEPFDVFICYKETDDATNERTRDSIDAQEIYYQLTNEGYRVFFSRITLEDKVGTEYEPYIFAALNSAKVMVVIGSKPEYLNAVWVKNEWSRFIALMRKDRSKLLIPCYKDMDPYDLPEQLSVLQSYDMTKIGFVQDLLHGIKKVAVGEETKPVRQETFVVNTGGAGAASLLERAFMFLEDGNWASADEYAERVLDLEPKNSEAYLVKLMVWGKARVKADLANCPTPFHDNADYLKIERFGSEDLRKELAEYIAFINERNENDRLTDQEKEEIHQKALMVIEAFRNFGVAKNQLSPEESLAAAKQRVTELATLLNGFETLQAEMAKPIAYIHSAEARISELTSKRASLGKFAGREKRNIEEELKTLEAGKQNAEMHLQNLKASLHGYQTTAEAERDLEAAKRVVTEWESRIAQARSQRKGVYSRDEALNLLQNDRRVAAETARIGQNEKLDPWVAALLGITDHISFGRYVQNPGNDKEPIEWQVLGRDGSRLLLISRYALAWMRYNKIAKNKSGTWEDSDLR